MYLHQPVIKKTAWNEEIYIRKTFDPGLPGRKSRRNSSNLLIAKHNPGYTKLLRKYYLLKF